MDTEPQKSRIKAIDVRSNCLFLFCYKLHFHFRCGTKNLPASPLWSLTDLWLLLIATFAVMHIAYYGLLMLSNFWKEKWTVWVIFWIHSRGISVLKRLYHKACYTIRILDTFMILHLSDVLLQRSVDMLYLINCLFIIAKVQCEKKSLDNFSHNSVWVQTKGQDGERRVSGNRPFVLYLGLNLPFWTCI